MNLQLLKASLTVPVEAAVVETLIFTAAPEVWPTLLMKVQEENRMGPAAARISAVPWITTALVAQPTKVIPDTLTPPALCVCMRIRHARAVVNCVLFTHVMVNAVVLPLLQVMVDGLLKTVPGEAMV